MTIETKNDIITKLLSTYFASHYVATKYVNVTMSDAITSEIIDIEDFEVSNAKEYQGVKHALRKRHNKEINDVRFKTFSIHNRSIIKPNKIEFSNKQISEFKKVYCQGTRMHHLQHSFFEKIHSCNIMESELTSLIALASFATGFTTGFIKSYLPDMHININFTKNHNVKQY